LPHTPFIEKYDIALPLQSISWYRKRFTPDAAWKDKKIFLEFEAAMQVADVWVNGQLKTTHAGGYLPFTVDLTPDLKFDQENTFIVRTDNRDNADGPRGNPATKLDFCFFGGLYRNTRLRITDKLHVTDPVYAGKTAGGGVFVCYTDVTAESA